MAEPEEINDIEFEYSVTPEAMIELDPEWVAWLEAEPVPSNVDGVDPSLTIGVGDAGIA